MNKQIQYLQNKWKQEERNDMARIAIDLSGLSIKVSDAIVDEDFVDAEQVLDKMDDVMAKLREYVTKRLSSQ